MSPKSRSLAYGGTLKCPPTPTSSAIVTSTAVKAVQSDLSSPDNWYALHATTYCLWIHAHASDHKNKLPPGIYSTLLTPE